MTTPLPDSVSATLRSDPIAALGALMVIASAHAELFSWAARMVCDATSTGASTNVQPEASTNAQPQPRAKGNGVEPHGAKPPGTRKASTPPTSAQDAQPKPNGSAAHLALRREARDRDDERLLEAMRESPEASIRDWAAAIGKSRTSTVAGLHRLRDAGLATNADKAWALAEESPPKETRRWVEPLKGADRAAYAHLTAS
jgi:hypothetical protein